MSQAEELFARYLPIAKRIARGFKRSLPRNVLLEDLEAAAFVGLWQAVNADPDRQGFEWYVRVRIRGAVLDELRAQDWLPRRARSNAQKQDAVAPAVVRFDDLGAAESGLIIGNDVPADEQLDARDVRRRLETAFADLPERLKLIMLRILSGVTQRQIGVELGLSEPRINQLKAIAIKSMRQQIARAGAPPEPIAEPAPGGPIDHARDGFSMIGDLWQEICAGQWRITRLLSTDECFGFEVERCKKTPMRPPVRSVFEHWIAQGHAKVTASHFGMHRSTVSETLTEAIVAIGLSCSAKQVPLVVSLAAQAPAQQSCLSHLATTSRVEFSRDPRLLASVPAVQRQVTHCLLDGLSTQEIALLRGTARDTIANQTHSVFVRLNVSGVNELRAVVARSLLDLAIDPASSPQ